ncbi:hypothetical protein GLOIN_2v1773702 [Rhizophagus clarus]|uniref:TLDc domain-containing protein n=1 Tax=Rhizophagus clarus TaxID=94130 RepID=A0A8H3LYU5_9GLOM|nr:hypothetical protein GLOIN_2v1773702 [Rhizophagus clarus]
MVTQFFSKLSQNYIELLKDNEYYDVTIEVGEDPNNNDNVLAHIKLSNASSEIFQIILEYIYGGILSLDEKNASDLLEILATSISLIFKNYSQSINLLKLQEFCTNLMVQSPEKILKSLNFTSLPEKSLISIIKSDDLQMKEIEVWEHVLKWGLAQNPGLIPDPKTWSDDEFKIMRNTLQHCLPLVRFFCLSSKEFSQKVRPYQKILNQQLYEDLLNFYLEPDSVSSHNIQRPRKIKVDEVICSLIVDSGIVSTISRWIDKVDVNDNNFKELYLPYKFELLLRGSRDGFTPKRFHELCDNKSNTVTFIKVKGTEEIIGGYNPLEWKSSSSWGETKDSFIFSFKNKNNFKDAILSNVKSMDCDVALWFDDFNGPHFGNDILMEAPNESIDYDLVYCKQVFYEKKIRDSEAKFTVEDYEIFQIVKK